MVEKQAAERAIEMLKLVGLPRAKRFNEGLSASIIRWDETASHDCDGARL